MQRRGRALRRRRWIVPAGGRPGHGTHRAAASMLDALHCCNHRQSIRARQACLVLLYSRSAQSAWVDDRQTVDHRHTGVARHRLALALSSLRHFASTMPPGLGPCRRRIAAPSCDVAASSSTASAERRIAISKLTRVRVESSRTPWPSRAVERRHASAGRAATCAALPSLLLTLLIAARARRRIREIQNSVGHHCSRTDTGPPRPRGSRRTLDLSSPMTHLGRTRRVPRRPVDGDSDAAGKCC